MVSGFEVSCREPVLTGYPWQPHSIQVVEPEVDLLNNFLHKTSGKNFWNFKFGVHFKQGVTHYVLLLVTGFAILMSNTLLMHSV